MGIIADTLRQTLEEMKQRDIESQRQTEDLLNRTHALLDDLASLMFDDVIVTRDHGAAHGHALKLRRVVAIRERRPARPVSMMRS